MQAPSPFQNVYLLSFLVTWLGINMIVRKCPDVLVCCIIVPLNNASFSVTYISNKDSSHLGLQFSVLDVQLR